MRDAILGFFMGLAVLFGPLLFLSFAIWAGTALLLPALGLAGLSFGAAMGAAMLVKVLQLLVPPRGAYTQPLLVALLTHVLRNGGRPE